MAVSILYLGIMRVEYTKVMKDFYVNNVSLPYVQGWRLGLRAQS